MNTRYKRSLGTSKREQGIETPKDPNSKIAKAIKAQFPRKKKTPKIKLTKEEKKKLRTAKSAPTKEMVQINVPVERKSNKGVKYLTYVPALIPKAEYEAMQEQAQKKAEGKVTPKNDDASI